MQLKNDEKLVINCFWIGSELGAIHAACVRSFLRHGHRVVLHCYEPPIDLPSGVETFDAAKLMAKSDIIHHRKTGSLALASDLYRLRIQQHGMGIYADCDVYCLKPFKDTDYLFGWEQSHEINGAILRLPKESVLLKNLSNFCSQIYPIAPWLKPEKKTLLGLRKMIGFPVHVSRQPWGTFGPAALTYFIKELNLEHLAEPIDTFYAFYGSHWPLLNEPSLTIADLVTPRSVAIHLCSSGFKSIKIARNSPLDEIVSS